MQTNRRHILFEPEGDSASSSPVHSRTSVWIDPVAQHDISAAYISAEEPRMPENTKRTRDLSLEEHIQNPHTPIPARASSIKAASPVKVRPRYPRSYTIPLENDITRNPTSPQPTAWQYETPDYDAESSLSALSLAYPERVLEDVPTIPPVSPISPVPLPHFHAIDEIDTQVPAKRKARPAQKSAATKTQKKDKGFSLPFARSARPQQSSTVSVSRALSDIPTVPPSSLLEAAPEASKEPIANKKIDFLARVHTSSTTSKNNDALADPNSWTAGKGKNSALAKRVVERSRYKRTTTLNPLDKVRWWLLYPGRIEFLLWLSGTIVLVGVTCFLLFATLMSAGWLNTGFTPITMNTSQDNTVPVSSTPGQKSVSGSSACSTTDASKPRCHSTTVIAPSGLQLTLIDNTILLPGTPIYVHGQGFTRSSAVNFTYDTSFPCNPSTIVADRQGTFSLDLYLGVGVRAGIHQIEAYDVATKNLVTVNVSISPAPIGKTVQSTPTPAEPVSGATPTATSGAGGGTGTGGGLPTPVGQTPVPITPTVVVSPTKAPTQAPTPTVGITPTATIGVTPTVGVTPTATLAPSPTAGTQTDSSTPTPAPTAGTQADSTVLLQSTYAAEKELRVSVPVTLWVWMAILGYTISMTLLGCAGLLYRRNRSASMH